MSSGSVELAVERQVAVLTLNHPPANVLSFAVLDELARLIDDVQADRRVRVVVLTGTGRFFCAGAALTELAEISTAAKGAELAARGQSLLNRIERLDKPVIAAINGMCVGGGLELALACHVRIAAAGAMLGLPEAKLGLIPGFGGTQRLPRIIGPSRAAEMMLTGESLTAEQADAWGLVNQVVPAAEVRSAARNLAAKMAANGRPAIHATLQAIRTALSEPLTAGFAREAELFGELCETPEKKEGIQAFLEKRAPRFSETEG